MNTGPTDSSVIEVITGDPGKTIADALALTPAALPVTEHIVQPAPGEPPKQKQFVSRRTFDGLRPRAPRGPSTAEESLSLRKAELKRRRKAAARQAQLLRSVPVIPVPMEVAADIEYEPAAPAPFVVLDVAGGTP